MRGTGASWEFTFPDGITERYTIKDLRPVEHLEDDVETLFVWAWTIKDYLTELARARGHKPILWESVEEHRLHPVDSPFPLPAACVSRGQSRITQYRQQFKSTRPGAVIEALDGGLTARVRWQVSSDTRADIAAMTDYRKSLEALLTLDERNLAGSSLTLDVTDFPYVEIRRDGSIAPPRIEQSSGSSFYDRAAASRHHRGEPVPAATSRLDQAVAPRRLQFRAARAG